MTHLHHSGISHPVVQKHEPRCHRLHQKGSHPMFPSMKTNIDIRVRVALSQLREGEVRVWGPCQEGLCNGIHGFTRCAILKSVGEVILGGRPLWFSLEESIVRHSIYAMSHGGCDASSSPDASNLYRWWCLPCRSEASSSLILFSHPKCYSHWDGNWVGMFWRPIPRAHRNRRRWHGCDFWNGYSLDNQIARGIFWGRGCLWSYYVLTSLKALEKLEGWSFFVMRVWWISCMISWKERKEEQEESQWEERKNFQSSHGWNFDVAKNLLASGTSIVVIEVTAE